jgi:hypothetical protein
MSMNLHLSGEREVTVNKTGKTSKQTVYFDMWQTPTDVTKEAIRGTDPKAVYISWVQSCSTDEQNQSILWVLLEANGRILNALWSFLKLSSIQMFVVLLLLVQLPVQGFVTIPTMM